MLRSNMHSVEKTLLNGITNEMTINVNVLSSFMKNMIDHNMKSSFAITKKESWLWMNNSEIPK
jgi:hypothetical protein